MPVSKRVTTALAAALLATTAACISDPNTGEQRVSKAAIGAGVGAVGGAVLTGGHPAGVVGGAVVGGVIGNQVGKHNGY